MPGTTASRQYFTIKIVQKLICPGFCPGKREPQYLSHLLEIYYQVRALLGEVNRKAANPTIFSVESRVCGFLVAIR